MAYGDGIVALLVISDDEFGRQLNTPPHCLYRQTQIQYNEDYSINQYIYQPYSYVLLHIVKYCYTYHSVNSCIIASVLSSAV